MAHLPLGISITFKNSLVLNCLLSFLQKIVETETGKFKAKLQVPHPL